MLKAKIEVRSKFQLRSPLVLFEMLLRTFFVAKSRRLPQVHVSVSTMQSRLSIYSVCALAVTYPIGSRSFSHKRAKIVTAAHTLIYKVRASIKSLLEVVWLVMSVVIFLYFKGVRPRMERPRVTSSVYSRSSPTLTPLASTDSLTFVSAKRLEM